MTIIVIPNKHLFIIQKQELDDRNVFEIKAANFEGRSNNNIIVIISER